jgi:aminoglycoside 6'-N-acetyltransferase I
MPGIQTIRAAEADDRDELIRLISALFPHTAEDLPSEIEEYLNPSDARRIFVAQRANGRLAGFVEVGTRPYAEGCDTSPVGYIEAWFVDEDLRCSGVGRELIRAAEDWARERGLTEIASDALIENEVSIEAHKRIGYEEVERIVCFRKPLT